MSIIRHEAEIKALKERVQALEEQIKALTEKKESKPKWRS